MRALPLTAQVFRELGSFPEICQLSSGSAWIQARMSSAPLLREVCFSFLNSLPTSDPGVQLFDLWGVFRSLAWSFWEKPLEGHKLPSSSPWGGSWKDRNNITRNPRIAVASPAVRCLVKPQGASELLVCPCGEMGTGGVRTWFLGTTLASSQRGLVFENPLLASA